MLHCKRTTGLFFFLINGLALSAIASPVHTDKVDLGTTFIEFTNNSSVPLHVSVQQKGDKLDNKYWQQLNSEIPAYETRKLLSFNRFEGIKPGKNHYFETEVTGEGIFYKLQQKLVGQPIGTKFWYGAMSNGWQTPYYYDNDIHRRQSWFNEQKYTLAMRAVPTIRSYNDVNYVFQPARMKPHYSEDKNTLDVMTYNIWMMPFRLAQYEPERAKLLPEVMTGYDVVMIEEIFEKDMRKKILKSLESDYPYQTEVIAPKDFVNGGVVILSRWPIEVEKEYVYKAKNYEKFDFVSSKGVKYAVINKHGKRYHLLATHTHAWASPKSKAVRHKQLLEMHEFVESLHIPRDEPLLLGGDLNIDKLSYPHDPEYGEFVNLFQLGEPLHTGYGYSFDTKINTFANHDEPRQLLDYVYYFNEHQRPHTATNSALFVRSLDKKMWGKWDISDHYPVWGHFEF